MFGLQPLHIVFIIVIALLIFGPSRFAGLGRGFGKMFSEFRSASKDPDENSENSSFKKSEPPKTG
jgi:sec-independent protein translocase protein TatA